MNLLQAFGMGMMALTVVGGLIAVPTILVLVVRKQRRPAMVVVGVGIAWAFLYGSILGGVSLASRGDLIRPGGAKAFCGAYIDCHIHVAVEDAVRERESNRLHVKLRLFSDARREPLYAGPVSVALVDGAGRRYARDRDVERALLQVELPARLEPNESVTREYVFDVSREARDLRLDVGESDWVTRGMEFFLIGDEDSALHARTLLGVTPREP